MSRLIPFSLVLLSSCAHFSVYHVRPGMGEVVDETVITLEWKIEGDYLPEAMSYRVYLSLNEDFSPPVVMKFVKENWLTFDLSELSPSMKKPFTVFWRVNFQNRWGKWTKWSETFHFSFQGKVKRRKEIIKSRFREPEKIPYEVKTQTKIPDSLVLGGRERLDPSRLLAVPAIKGNKAATLYLMARLYESTGIRQVERLRIDPLTGPPVPIRTDPQNYRVDEDELGRIVSNEDILIWKQPDAYLFMDVNEKNGIFSICSRIVDIRTGVIPWQYNRLVFDADTPENAMAYFLDHFKEELKGMPPEIKRIVIGEVNANEKPSKNLKEMILLSLIEKGNIGILQRGLPVTKRVARKKIEKDEAGNNIVVMESTIYYKLYQDQFSCIARDGGFVWVDAEDALIVEFGTPIPSYPSAAIQKEGLTEEEIEAFFEETPLRALSAKLVNQRTGELRTTMHILARADIGDFEMINRLVEVLTK